jgi:predicted MFS family arabinose efflux permease
MNFIVFNGAGRIVGAMLGGICSGYFGYAAVFASVGVLSLAAACWFWYAFADRSRSSLSKDAG